jgi:hypothetical protein
MPNETHAVLMAKCEENLSRTGVTQKGGKKYMMVKDRLTFFRQFYGLKYGIATELIFADELRVQCKAEIIDENGRIIGSGMAEELRGSSPVNKASALENCESSAIGRALASLALHGGEYPTLDEIQSDRRSGDVIDLQKKMPAKPRIQNASSANWKEWTNEMIDGMKKHKTMAEHQAWTNSVNENLEELKKESPSDRERLLVAFQKRKSELLNQGEGNE